MADEKFIQRQALAVYIRNFTFGVEDSLVSTVGLISGIAAAGVSEKNIVLTGIVLIFVEAFSMGVGSLLSEHSAEEFATRTPIGFDKPVKSSLVMFIAYFLSGFIPLAPYLWLKVHLAFPISIIASIVALFILGAISGKAFGTGLMRNGSRMALIGGIAIAMGVLVGRLVS